MEKAYVYRITNTVNKKSYIGSTLNIPKRWGQHLCSLKRGDHSCKSLQRDFYIYGIESFEIKQIDVIEADTRLKAKTWAQNREKQWQLVAKTWLSEYGYNDADFNNWGVNGDYDIRFKNIKDIDKKRELRTLRNLGYKTRLKKVGWQAGICSFTNEAHETQLQKLSYRRIPWFKGVMICQQ